MSVHNDFGGVLLPSEERNHVAPQALGVSRLGNCALPGCVCLGRSPADLDDAPRSAHAAEEQRDVGQLRDDRPEGGGLDHAVCDVVSYTAKDEAFTAEQRDRFLEAMAADLAFWRLFFVMSRTGIRMGEAAGLSWPNVDLASAPPALWIRASRSRRRMGPPKSGRHRAVDLSKDATAVVQGLKDAPGARFSPWVFRLPSGRQMDQPQASRAFTAGLERAGLPDHFSPHTLRHTYATLMLDRGAEPLYVCRQLGHASLAMTVDLYAANCRPKGDGAVDRLDVVTPAGSSQTKKALGE